MGHTPGCLPEKAAPPARERRDGDVRDGGLPPDDGDVVPVDALTCLARSPDRLNGTRASRRSRPGRTSVIALRSGGREGEGDGLAWPGWNGAKEEAAMTRLRTTQARDLLDGRSTLGPT